MQGDTEDEAIAFIAACAHTNATHWGSALLERAIVVHNADAWRSLEGHPCSLVLLRDFSDNNVSSQVAVSRGHHILIPLGGHQEPSGDGITLPRLGRDETLSALTTMGLSETKARLLTRSTARRLAIIRRRLIDEAGGPIPDWASPSTPHSIVVLALVGQWQGDHEGDKAIVAEIVGQPYETIERDMTALMSASDSPLTRIGNLWRFVSHEEAWHLLAPRLTPSDVERFRQVATDVFATVSPEFELSKEERYMASLLGKRLAHSGTLREGMARSLALMGTHSDRAKNAEGAAYVPVRVVSSILEHDNSWQLWATLSGHLAVLSEASPEAVLDAIERGLALDPSPFEDLFAQAGDGLFGGVPHTGLLWALEGLSWPQDYFARVARILARLAEMDPGGLTSNRPAESLRALFLPWMRFSEASDGHRLETLKMLLDAVPAAAWRLLVGAYPSSRELVMGRQPPSWRPWAQDGVPRPTVGECNTFVRELERLLLTSVGADADRWVDMVGILSHLPPEARQRAIEQLSQQTDTFKKHQALDNFWTNLRKELHHHNSHPDAAWAMEQSDLRALESVYLELTPSDPVAAHAWLFDSWPKPHNAPPVDLTRKPMDFSERDNQVAEARQAAVRAAYETGGRLAILGLAEAAEDPRQLGASLALTMDHRLVFDLAWEHLGSPAPKLRDFARGAFVDSFRQSGWTILEEAIDRIKAGDSRPQALADVYLAAPALRETWQKLDSESQEVKTTYWKSIWPPVIMVLESEDFAFAVQQLLSVRRSADVVSLLALRPMPNQLVVQILEAVPSDFAASGDWAPRVDTYGIARLFEKLDDSDDIPDELIAKLEVPYVGMLEYDRPNLALHREVTKQPSRFADLITWAFKRSDGQAEEAVDEQTRQRRATLAYSLIWKLRTLPGLMEDGSVDVESLSTWVKEARRLCKERARGDIGDEQIGQVLANAPVGKDGIWPCEPVRNLLDSLASRHIGTGFAIGKRNLRGMTTRSAFEGGRQERSLAEAYRRDAAKIVARWPFTSQLLSDLAAAYDDDAKREDQIADWSDQFES